MYWAPITTSKTIRPEYSVQNPRNKNSIFPSCNILYYSFISGSSQPVATVIHCGYQYYQSTPLNHVQWRRASLPHRVWLRVASVKRQTGFTYFVVADYLFTLHVTQPAGEPHSSQRWRAGLNMAALGCLRPLIQYATKLIPESQLVCTIDQLAALLSSPPLTVPDLQRLSNMAEELANHKTLLDNSTKERRKLEDENAALRAEVEMLRRASASQDKIPMERLPKPSSAMPNGVLESSDPDMAQKLEYAKLAQRFRLLNENFSKARAALERRKAERDAWRKRYEALLEQVTAAKCEHGVEISSRASAALAALQPVSTSFGSSFNSTADPADAGVEQAEPELPALPALPPMAPKSSTSSRSGAILGPLDSTQGDSEANDLPSLPATTPAPSDAPESIIKNEPSSDGPVVISERPVKKRKSNAHDTAARPSARVKPEPEEISSPAASEMRIPASQESIDLGSRTNMITPRKPRGPGPAPPALAPLAPIYRIPSINADSAVTPVARYVRADEPVPQTARASVMSSALTPISINRRMIRSGGDQPSKLSRKRQLDAGIADIAEDGVNISHGHARESGPVGRMQMQSGHQTPRTRLHQLLHEPEVDDSPSLSRPARPGRPGRKDGALATADLNIPERRELPFDKQVRQNRPVLSPASTAAQPTSRSRSPQRSPQRPAKGTPGGGGRLRQKPPRELQLDDFRVNPAANEGHDFAFSDVVRDKDDRACLPGCTLMHCCGKQFRALAISQRPNPPLTPAQRLEEQKLLEEHLGDYAYRLATMDPRERAEAWIEAKTQELANKYGKHRHRYSRMQSPPGFWDADFPSTQELEANREEAAEREKRAIRERYREAMRPGGRWMFRDE